ncbi:glutamyl-tRNA amidotransferase [candidate division KD3-62 bacterium DG_56]|uniref:Aspartyl/glutamyl-tRNA(Asn/Gln) amidotransferase subunit B n=1 Tax=candidate division KD3-62 bacterium DG_56 TaxID=1704032 RepID=A0A0S7XI17_9BACT|nr:MAG: glutamyl-tRNA amidotransferase [candidate division KD3-62 bacterium DG_56]
MSDYEAVIGLETHVELTTRSKVFCGCSTEFGAPPNTQVCPVCLGYPGVLPVLNREVVEYALRVAIALGSEINSQTIFERKNYYYPDLPKNYQISQKRFPLGVGGRLDFLVDGELRTINMWEIHIEEDAGKLLHPDDPRADYSLVDYNRSGMPLLEMICAPELHTLQEVEGYMHGLRNLLLYLEVSDCAMEKGHLRFEANVDVRPAGLTGPRPRVEMKNLNSFRAVLRALGYEIDRQTELLRSGGEVIQETRLWDDARGVTRPMRTKEQAQDYRYFPEPDLLPLEIDRDWIERVRASLPELPAARRQRYVEQYGLPEYDAAVLTADKGLADFFERTVQLGADPKAASNWTMGSLVRMLKERELEISQAKVSPDHLARMLALIDDGTISGKIAKGVFEEMFESGASPDDIVREKGLTQISDTGELGGIVEEVIEANPDVVESYLGGKEKSIGFLVGQIMKKTGGRANPQMVNQLLRERLEAKKASS